MEGAEVGEVGAEVGGAEGEAEGDVPELDEVGADFEGLEAETLDRPRAGLAIGSLLLAIFCETKVIGKNNGVTWLEAGGGGARG